MIFDWYHVEIIEIFTHCLQYGPQLLSTVNDSLLYYFVIVLDIQDTSRHVNVNNVSVVLKLMYCSHNSLLQGTEP